MWLSSTPRLYRIYGPSMDDVLAENDIFGNKIRFLHKDALGSITLVTGEDGTRGYRTMYKAFGQATSTTDLGTGVSNLGYTGREVGAWGTMYYRARHFEMSTGRFMQQDSYSGNPSAPPSLQRYLYCLNNPIEYRDPSGHTPEVAALFSMLRGVGLAVALGVLTLIGAHVAKRTDLVYHFAAGFGGTAMAMGAILWLGSVVGAVTAANAVAAIAMWTVIAIAIGAALEELVFNTGGFDKLDFLFQTLGAMAAAIITLIILKAVSPVADFGVDVAFPIFLPGFGLALLAMYLRSNDNQYPAR